MAVLKTNIGNYVLLKICKDQFKLVDDFLEYSETRGKLDQVNNANLLLMFWSLDNIWRRIFCGGDEKWIIKIFFGEEVYCAWLIKWVAKREIIQLAQQ